jgi:hypothetical protein
LCGLQKIVFRGMDTSEKTGGDLGTWEKCYLDIQDLISISTSRHPLSHKALPSIRFCTKAARCGAHYTAHSGAHYDDLLLRG